VRKTTRTFVAVQIDRPIQRRAAALVDRLSRSEARVRWVDPSRLHFTLKFLGEVATTELHEVCQAVARGASRLAPFSVEVCGAGAFPRIDRPRTLWLGVGEGADQMIELAVAIDLELAELGFAREGRSFVPHLTLGRVRGGAPLAALGAAVTAAADYPAGKLIVQQAMVLASRLQPDGPEYDALASAPLQGE
jgi:2'-5' RNA ligase